MSREPRMVLALLALAVAGHAARVFLSPRAAPPGELLASSTGSPDPAQQRARAARVARPLRDGEVLDVNTASAEELARKVRRLEREADALARLLDGRSARRQAGKLLPGDGRDERIAKYERHLHNLLTSTLHELERLQARRGGESVPPPAVADVNVTIEPG